MSSVYIIEYPDSISREPIFGLRDYDSNGHFSWFSQEEKNEKYENEGNEIIKSLAGSFHRGQCGKFDEQDLMWAGQEGFAKAIATFDPRLGTEFRTFCTTVVRNSMLDMIRRERKRRQQTTYFSETEDPDSGLSLESRLAGGADIQRDAYTDYLLKCTLECLELLPDKRREILCRSVAWLNPEHRSETQKEIAKKMHCSQALVSKTLERARADIKLFLWSLYKIDVEGVGIL